MYVSVVHTVMSLRQSFLTKRYSNFCYFDRAHVHDDTYIYIHVCTCTYYGWATVSLSSFHREFRQERKPDFAEEESVGLLKALRRGRRDQ